MSTGARSAGAAAPSLRTAAAERSEPGRARGPGRRLFVVLGAALLVVAVGVALVLSRTGEHLAGSNSVRVVAYSIHLKRGQQVCQGGEILPSDAAAMRLRVGTNGLPGPPLSVSIGGISRRVPGGYRDGTRIVPLRGAQPGPARLCIRDAGRRDVWFAGQDARVELPAGYSVTIDGTPQAAIMRVDYLRAGTASWWSELGTVIRHWGYFTALGAATPWIAVALVVAAFAAGVTLVIRRRASPLAIGLVAAAVAGAWAFTTPVFQVPDEPQHIAYAQYLAETGKLPTPTPGAVFSPEESVAFQEMRVNSVVGEPDGRQPFTAYADAATDRALDRDPGRLSGGARSNTTNNPPLYYLLEAGPYWAASGGDFFDRVLAMRLLSCLLTGLTVAFSVLFVRELLPGRTWAAAAGGVALAFQPLLGFIGGGVNNDNALNAAAAAALWLVVRALRRGLDRRVAIGIGAAVGLGLVAKATLVSFAPALLLCAALLVWRAPSPHRRRVLARVVLAACVAAVPVVAYLALNATVWDRPLWTGGGSVTTTGTGQPSSLRQFAVYLWEFYLPRLPFMQPQQVGLPLYNVWFKGFIGHFGWLDTDFPAFAYTIAIVVYAGVLGLVGRALWVARRAVRARWAEIAVLVAVVLGHVVVVGWAGYQGRLNNGYIFEQTRYLFVLAPLYAGLIALATRGAGRRWTGPVAALLVVLALAHEVFSSLLVVGRYYG